MTSKKAALPKVPKSGASISREMSWADVSSASFLHVILNLVSSINAWQSPLCTGSPAWKVLLRLYGSTLRLHLLGASADGSRSPLPPHRIWWWWRGLCTIKCSDQHLLVLSLEERWDLLFLPKAEDWGRGKRLAAPVWAAGWGGLQCTPARGHRAGVLPQARISFYCEQ